jgi:hypothetical protein
LQPLDASSLLARPNDDGRAIGQRMGNASQKPVILSLSAVTAGYGDIQSLWDIDLVVPEGEVVDCQSERGQHDDPREPDFWFYSAE